MDAVNLALPVNNLPNAAMAGGDNNPGLGSDGEKGAVDFATLLAAGIDLQQQLFDPEGVPTTEATDVPNLETDPAALTADPAATPAEVPALPIPAPIIGRTPVAEVRGGQGDAADGRPAAPLAAGDMKATQTAADTARIAASAFAAESEKTAAAETPEFRLDAGKEMQTFVETTAAQRTDAAESAVQTFNVQSTEQRPAVQQQPVAVREVGAPVGSAGFADELSRQVVWMVDKDAQIAELRINPPDLGPVEVRLSVSGDHATAQFVSAQAEVREALETSLARLREAFAQAGIQLGEASVGAESFREQAAGQAETRNGRNGYSDNGPSLPASTSADAAQTVRRGLVDTFV